MTPTDPETRSLLAAEYVLGTLRGGARRRVEKLVAEQPAWRDEVALWQEHLHRVMTEHIAPEAVPDAVWQRVRERIESLEGAPGGATAAPPAVGRRSPEQRLRRRRRAWAAVAAMLLVGIFALLLPERVEHTEPPVPAPQPLQRLASIELEATGMRWEVSLRGQALVVHQPQAEGVDPGPEQDFELWWVGEDAPVSLGVLPRRGQVERPIPEAVGTITEGALAVSREPRGGSPDGTPSEVLQVFPLSES